VTRRLTRRKFLSGVGAAACGAAAAAYVGRDVAAAETGAGTMRARPHPQADAWKGRIGLAQKSADPGAGVQTAIEKLCGPDGVRTFVRQGDLVVVKPNMSWAQPPEMGANVHPDIVARVVTLCRKAGARQVKVFDNTIGSASKCYEFSGIEAAARNAGADVVVCAGHRFRTVRFDDPRAKNLKEWPIYEDALAADVFINIAVAKVHNATYVTLCMKNLMGTQGGNRGKMHQGIHQNLADLAVIIRPTFNILDATRVMITNGPGGGRAEYVVRRDMILCGTSAVTVDAWAADPSNLPWPKGHHDLAAVEHIALGAAAGLGVADPSRIEVAA
jgi:uncharacterized protein (DUF362 family)